MLSRNTLLTAGASSLTGTWVLLALLACKHGADRSRGEPTATSSGEPVAAAGPARTPTSEQPLASKLEVMPDLAVDAGLGSNGVWTPRFQVRRDEGDTGKHYLEAAQFCQSKGRMLCTETQWLRACGSNVRIGNYQSWTASWQGEQVIVRGGKGCDDRQTVSGASRSAVRVALCCERAVGIKTDNRQLAFMKVAHADQLRYERAYNAGNTAELHALWYGSVEFDGTVQTKDRLRTKQEQWFRQHPKRWMLFDICEVKLGPVLTGLGKTLKSPGLIHDCSTVSVVGDLVTVVMTEFGRYRAEGDTANRVVQVKHHSRTRKLSKL